MNYRKWFKVWQRSREEVGKIGLTVYVAELRGGITCKGRCNDIE
jgi:hypothetical protein